MENETNEIEHDELTAETLSGDLRDVMLTHVRAMENPWSKLSEKDQQEKIDVIEKACADVVRRAVKTIAGRGFDKLEVTLTDFSVKGGEIKGKFKRQVSENAVIQLADHENEIAMIVLASAADFIGEKEAAKADPDQTELDVNESGDAGDAPDTAGIAADETVEEPA